MHFNFFLYDKFLQSLEHNLQSISQDGVNHKEIL